MQSFYTIEMYFHYFCSSCYSDEERPVKALLKLIQYNNYNWDECGDLKMIALLFKEALYIKYSFFLLLEQQSE